MLKDILSISGKPGLFKMLNSTGNSIIVESLVDGKRMAVYSNSKVISLKEISIYTDNEDMPLSTVFKRIAQKENNGSTISHKESAAVISNYIESIIPEYDRDRVYLSDMKKMLQWYNTLLEKNMLNFNEEEEQQQQQEESAPQDK